MGLRIATNTDANNTYRSLNINQNMVSKSMEKLSSGYRINRAADDAAGLSIAEGLKAQSGALKMAARNAQDGVSLIQTVDGVLGEVTSMLQRQNELAVAYSNGTQNSDSLAALQSEFDALTSEIERLGEATKFNGIGVFSNSTAAQTATTFNFQVGEASTDAPITVDLSGLDLTALTHDITQSETVQADIATISATRSDLGAVQNRLEYAASAVTVTAENLTASESRIRDVDMAQEMVKFSKNNILQQAGTSMLAQANQAGQGVLQLLR